KRSHGVHGNGQRLRAEHSPEIWPWLQQALDCECFASRSQKCFGPRLAFPVPRLPLARNNQRRPEASWQRFQPAEEAIECPADSSARWRRLALAQSECQAVVGSMLVAHDMSGGDST